MHQWRRPVLVYPVDCCAAIQGLPNRRKVTEQYAAQQIVIGRGRA